MSAPHPRPAWTLTVDGEDITAPIARRLIALTLTDNPGFEADQLDLTLDDSDGALALPPRGAAVRLRLGWEGAALIDKGEYIVDEIEHSGAPDQLSIRARSADLRGGLTTQMERSFHGVTLGGIVRTIADENDLRPKIAPDLDAEWFDHLDQTNESSANLLTRLARQFDAIASVKDGNLLFMRAGQGRSASGKPLPVASLARQDGDQHRFTLAERESYTAVKATYYDTHAGTKGEVFWAKEEEEIARGKRQAAAAPLAVSLPKFQALKGTYKSRDKAQHAARIAWKKLAPKDGWDGVKAEYVDRTNLKNGQPINGWASYGRADEAKKNSAAVAMAERDAAKLAGAPVEKPAFDHSADQVKTLRHVYASRENAKRAARSEYLRRGRGTATFSLALARGRPELFPGVPVAVSGFKQAIDETEWIAARVTHNLTDAGFTTAVEMEIRSSDIPG